MIRIIGIVFIAFFIICPSWAATETLKDLARAKGVDIGAAVAPSHLSESDYAQTLATQFNYISPENDLKREIVNPSKGVFNFKAADQMADWAKAHKFPMRGHTLLWHNQNPAWVEEFAGHPAEAKKYLREYILTVVGRYKGIIKDWDVVNEVFDENGKLRTDSIWFRAIGPEYIEFAFRVAREADPSARLFINDYATETVNIKSDALFQFVKEMRAKGVPIDGVGFQFHLDGSVSFDFTGAARNMKRFGTLGCDIQFTEVDLRLPTPVDQDMLAKQAKMYADLLRLGLSTPGFNAFITWGVSDKYSWIPGFFNGFDQGLLFDKSYNPKSAISAMTEAIKDPTIGPGWLDKTIAAGTFGRTVPPFRAVSAKTEPKIDGIAAAGEWDDSYTFAFPFNQLDANDLRGIVDPSDLKADWRIKYVGNKVFGMVRRTDNSTVTTMKNRWDNDNLEVFYRLGTVWHQYRSVAGGDWDDSDTGGHVVWSKDYTIIEFSLTLPTDDLTGKTIAWNIALSDNDDNRGRIRQVYPVAGTNLGWQGREFAEITFQNKQGMFPAGDVVGEARPFRAPKLNAAPKLDGDIERIWKDTPIYPLAYNQKGGKDQTPPAPEKLGAAFASTWFDGSLYGCLYISTKKIDANDSFNLWIDNGEKVEAIAIPRSNSEKGSFKITWSTDKTTAEWSWTPADTKLIATGKRLSFNLSYGNSTTTLFPIPGYSAIKDAGSLSEQMTRAGLEMATLSLE